MAMMKPNCNLVAYIFVTFTFGQAKGFGLSHGTVSHQPHKTHLVFLAISDFTFHVLTSCTIIFAYTHRRFVICPCCSMQNFWIQQMTSYKYFFPQFWSLTKIGDGVLVVLVWELCHHIGLMKSSTYSYSHCPSHLLRWLVFSVYD